MQSPGPEAGHGLKWYCCGFAGVDQLSDDSLYASPDVVLSNSSGAYGLTISEHILMVTLMLLRQMPEFQDIVRRREWVSELPMRSIYGSRITVLGAGDIGTNFARRAKALGAGHICGVSRSGRNRTRLLTGCCPRSSWTRCCRRRRSW